MITMTKEEIVKLEELVTFNYRSDAEKLGYQLAPTICQTRGYSPEVLLLVSLTQRGYIKNPEDTDVDEFLSEAYANLGVMRWCLDQRARKLH